MQRVNHCIRRAGFSAALLLLAAAGAMHCANAAAPAGVYQLGPGDLIQIQVYGEDDLNVQTRLPGSGQISYPFLGEITVQGLTVRELRNTISNGLAAKYIQHPDVQVYVLEYRPVYINGEVKKPGGYPYVPGLTVQKAVALAGGFTGLASTRHMYLTQENQAEGEPQKATLTTPVGPGDILFIDEGLF